MEEDINLEVKYSPKPDITENEFQSNEKLFVVRETSKEFCYWLLSYYFIDSVTWFDIIK